MNSSPSSSPSTHLGTKSFVPLLLLVHLLCGMVWCGPSFFRTFDEAVPTFPVGGEAAPVFMPPGDHFEQYSRYNLPASNLHHGHPLYYNGYQYNFDKAQPPFSEGWIFLPFNLLFIPLEQAFGPIAAFNLLALLSFPMVGLAMFLLVREVTSNPLAAALSSLILSLLPHRTSFLFGEMVFGMDLVWPPLIVFAVERLIRRPQRRFVIMLGFSLLFYATSNIQGFYLFAVFSSPYFAIRGWQMLQALRANGTLIRWLPLLCGMFLLPALYVIRVRSIVAAGALGSGQAYEETNFYSPTFQNALHIWSGNEKTVYLGWPLLLLVALAVLAWKGRSRLVGAEPLPVRAGLLLVIPVVGCFLVSYAFCFGTNLDSALHTPVFRSYFDYFPGGNGTRTPGRLMNTAGFHFAFLFGLAAAAFFRNHPDDNVRARLVRSLFGLTAALVIVCGYAYTNPLLVRFEKTNQAYEQIRNHDGIVLPIPFQREAAHYFNATFLFYAQKYNLRSFAGHSSYYPKEWNDIAPQFLEINNGQFDRAMKNRCQVRHIDRLIVHAAETEPRVSSFVLTRLRQSPFLRELASDHGITAFAINYTASGDQVFDPRTMAPGLARDAQGEVHFLAGWHQLESYPGQRAFRWTTGRRAEAVYFPTKAAELRTLSFNYKVPAGAIQLRVNGQLVDFKNEPLSGGWNQLTADLLPFQNDGYINFEVLAPDVFRSPPDTREFGCMVGQILID